MISQRARYAFKAVVARARAKPGVGLQIRELCEQEKLLRKFLEQILLTLKAACYISNRRGHDQEEAFELADRIAILNKGKIEQIGTPAQIVNHPASEFVAEFVGGIDLKRIDIIASSGAARQALKLQVVSSRLAR